MNPDSTVGRGSLQALNRDRPQMVAAAFNEKDSEAVDEKRVDSGANSFTMFYSIFGFGLYSSLGVFFNYFLFHLKLVETRQQGTGWFYCSQRYNIALYHS